MNQKGRKSSRLKPAVHFIPNVSIPRRFAFHGIRLELCTSASVEEMEETLKVPIDKGDTFSLTDLRHCDMGTRGGKITSNNTIDK